MSSRDMRRVIHTVSNSNYLEGRMCFRDLPLARDTKEREENDHRATASSEPEGSSDSIAISDQ